MRAQKDGLLKISIHGTDAFVDNGEATEDDDDELLEMDNCSSRRPSLAFSMFNRVLDLINT